MHFMHARDKQRVRETAYLNIVANIRPQKEDPYRIHFTIGRYRLEYPGPTTTETAKIQTANLLKDFYLGTPINRYEYMWIKMSDIPQDIIDHYVLKEKSVNGKVLVEIRKGMYGLK